MATTKRAAKPKPAPKPKPEPAKAPERRPYDPAVDDNHSHLNP